MPARTCSKRRRRSVDDWPAQLNAQLNDGDPTRGHTALLTGHASSVAATVQAPLPGACFVECCSSEPIREDQIPYPARGGVAIL